LIDKEARAREALALLNNTTLMGAIDDIERSAVEEMIKATSDEARRLAADRVRIVRAIPELLKSAIQESKATKPRIVA
jgi:hypothetical protein